MHAFASSGALNLVSALVCPSFSGDGMELTVPSLISLSSPPADLGLPSSCRSFFFEPAVSLKK